MDAIQQYGSSDEERQPTEDEVLHLKPLESKMSLEVNTAPDVMIPKEVFDTRIVDQDSKKQIMYNPTYEEMWAPKQGPLDPTKTQQQLAKKNMLTGFIEPAHVSPFQFENQRRTFHSYGFCEDPSVDAIGASKIIVSTTNFEDEPEKDEDKTKEEIVTRQQERKMEGGGNDQLTLQSRKTVFEKQKKRPEDKRKRVRNNDPSDLDGYTGPWARFVDEETESKPSEEMRKELDEMLAKRKKRNKKQEEKVVEEKSSLHIDDPLDYQGRNFLHIPQDLDVNLKSSEPPAKCYLPKKLIHTWSGHTKGVSSIKLFPRSGQLLLSTSMDTKVKLWEVYKNRRLIRTYSGHAKAVKDSCFSNNGEKFLTAAYDRFVKLWDTETGQCISKFSTHKIPYCVKFNPDQDKQHLFVVGTSDKKIVTFDINSGDTVQEYDRHLGAVNTITFVDNNTKFVSTSDDKSLRVWEWDIPVDFKYIADPSMHSMPSSTLSPNGKYLGCQSLDNQIVMFDVHGRFRVKQKKKFKGHMVAGYACQMTFSPEMSYVASGDGDGKVCIWDWKTTRMYSKFQAHDAPCLGCIWHPHETSKLITAGWDGQIKLWD